MPNADILGPVVGVFQSLQGTIQTNLCKYPYISRTIVSIPSRYDPNTWIIRENTSPCTVSIPSRYDPNGVVKTLMTSEKTRFNPFKVRSKLLIPKLYSKVGRVSIPSRYDPNQAQVNYTFLCKSVSIPSRYDPNFA